MLRRSFSGLDPVALLAAGLGLVTLFLPWLLLKPTRISPGVGYAALGLDPLWAVVLLVLWLILPGFKGTWRGLVAGLGVLAWGGLISAGAQRLLEEAGEFARVSPAGGFWLGIPAFYLAFFAAYRESGWRATWTAPVAFIALLLMGAFDRLGPTVELGAWRSQFGTELWRHLALSGSALIQAVLIGVPLGILASRGRGFNWVVGVTGFLQTIPSLALFGLLLAPLAWLSRAMSLEVALAILIIGALLVRVFRAVGNWAVFAVALPVGVLGMVVMGALLFGLLGPDPLRLALNAPLTEAGVRGIGAAPAVLALTLYALLPVVAGTRAGLQAVSDDLRQAGRGMGMSAQQLLFRVELPLALPLVMEGVRGAAVLTIGITTIAALIGAGGLGFFILRGVEGGAPDLVLLGAIPVIILALLIDVLLRQVGRWLTPRGVR
ncbi:MAG TPA: ABC transporter permease [Meiothermus sp.]|jgi:osmoprotectant transport system permease protein|nr:ABC transporter permease [Meiothermus sp.]